MKTYFLIIQLFLLSFSGFSQSGLESRKVAILPGSSLSITGNTNINEFECDFNTFYFEDKTITVNFSEKGDVLHFKNSVLPLENREFDCGNKGINKDFNSLLKTEKHPEILLKIHKIEKSSEEAARVRLKFRIAGIENDYSFPVTITGDEEELCFNGKLALNIGDFNLEAPKKMFGLIVIDEEIEINFNLNIRTREMESS